MRIKTLVPVALIGAAVLLAGCGGGGSSFVAAPTAPAVAPPFVDKFGTGFGADFQASATSTPAVPTASDILPLSLTTEPIPLH